MEEARIVGIKYLSTLAQKEGNIGRMKAMATFVLRI